MVEMLWTRKMQQDGLVYWVCEHGLSHPDLNSAKTLGIDPAHHCDGCCQRADFPGKLPVQKTTLLGKIAGEIDKFVNPLKYESDLERKERHRREDMAHQLKLEEVRRTRFVKADAGSKGDTKVVINDAMASEMNWMHGAEQRDPLSGILNFGGEEKKPPVKKRKKPAAKRTRR